MIEKTIMSQYANSPRLMHILTSLWDGINPEKFVSQYYSLIMNIPTANSFGLDIWGRIVGIGRTVNFPDPQGEYFGFIDGFFPFNSRPFASAGGSSSAWELTDDAYRELILVKALSNIVYATVPNINAVMKAMFTGPSYCLIVGHMQIRYVFEFDLTAYQRYLVYDSGILPRPCGVGVSVLINPPGNFGFNGSGLQPFSQGVFYNGAA